MARQESRAELAVLKMRMIRWTGAWNIDQYLQNIKKCWMAMRCAEGYSGLQVPSMTNLRLTNHTMLNRSKTDEEVPVYR